MESKDMFSSCSKDQEIQRLQEKARLSKRGCMNGFRELQTTTAFLLRKDFLSYNDTPKGAFERAFLQIFGVEVSTFKRGKLLIEKKLQTQGVHINTVQAVNVNSVMMENNNPGKEISTSEIAFSKSVKESSLDSETKDVHAIKYKMSKVKERCMAYFRSLHSHLQVLSKEDLKGTPTEHGFKRAFLSLFGQDDENITSMMFLNVDQLEKQLDKDEFQEDGSMAAVWIKHFRDTLLQHMSYVKKSIAERTHHKRQYDRRVNKRQMQTQEGKADMGKALDVGLVVTESSGTE
ncbi:hypothetical protein Tco_1166432 [Tanacetum coccineum]